MLKISFQSKSFIILFSVAVFGTFVCLNLLTQIYDSAYINTTEQFFKDKPAKNIGVANKNLQIEPEVDTSSWKTFSDSEFNLSFKYNPNWKILPTIKKSGYNIIQIDPGKKFFNIKIYISPENYYVMDGLPFSTETISGQSAMNVSDLLYGIKANSYYYTFDNGFSTSLKPDFKAMVHSVEFTTK